MPTTDTLLHASAASMLSAQILQGRFVCVVTRRLRTVDPLTDETRRTVTFLVSAPSKAALYEKLACLQREDVRPVDRFGEASMTEFGDVLEVAATHSVEPERIRATMTWRQHQLDQRNARAAMNDLGGDI